MVFPIYSSCQCLVFEPRHAESRQNMGYIQVPRQQLYRHLLPVKYQVYTQFSTSFGAIGIQEYVPEGTFSMYCTFHVLYQYRQVGTLPIKVQLDRTRSARSPGPAWLGVGSGTRFRGLVPDEGSGHEATLQVGTLHTKEYLIIRQSHTLSQSHTFNFILLTDSLHIRSLISVGIMTKQTSTQMSGSIHVETVGGVMGPEGGSGMIVCQAVATRSY